MCVAHRRVTNPLIPFCERWLPFLPGMRENRARHARVYELYDDMLKQLEVGHWALPMWCVICDGCAQWHWFKGGVLRSDVTVPNQT